MSQELDIHLESVGIIQPKESKSEASSVKSGFRRIPKKEWHIHFHLPPCEMMVDPTHPSQSLQGVETLSVSMIENKSTPTIRNRSKSRQSILRHVGMYQVQNRPKQTPRTRVENLIANRPIGRIELLDLRRYPPRTEISNWSFGRSAWNCAVCLFGLGK